MKMNIKAHKTEIQDIYLTLLLLHQVIRCRKATRELRLNR